MSLLAPAKRILEEYKTLVANMAECDSGIAKRNLRLLRDFETLLCLTLFIPLLECVNKVIKYAQLRDCYVCNFVNSVHKCRAELYRDFVDSTTAFTETRIFREFHGVVAQNSLDVDLIWLPHINTSEEYLHYTVLDFNYTCYRTGEDGTDMFISRMDFNFAIMEA
jgi:hypothetical protein